MTLEQFRAHTFVETNGITLHVVQAGLEDGPLVLLLHGFPDFWYGWRYQIPVLAEAGYRVCVPDLRGYNLSDKPQGLAAYNLDTLAVDVIGLIEAAGRQKAYIIGHDWGGAVAWWVANKYPERVEKLVIVNVAHHSAMRRYLRQSWRQRWRSLYMLFFQLPWLPEAVVSAAGWFLGRQMLCRTSRPGAFTTTDLERYRRAWSQPGAFTAMLNWYRAIARRRPQRPPSTRITVPALIIWGVQDVAFERQVAPLSLSYCDDGRLVFIEEATHWVQHEEVARVNALLLDFLT